MSSQVKFYIVSLLIGFTVMSIKYVNSIDELKKCQTDKYHVSGGGIQKTQTIDSLTNLSDSLRNELFIKGVEIGRYEIAFEIFKEKNKTGAQEFELILTTQTE